MGVRARVIYLVLAILTVSQLVWGAVQVRAETSLLRDEAIRRGQEVMRALAVPCSVALATREIETLDAILARFATSEGRDLDLLWVAILDVEGQVVAHTDPRQFGQTYSDARTHGALLDPNPQVFDLRQGGGPRLWLSMPIHSGLRWGTALAEVSLEGVEARITTQRNQLMATSLILALVIALVLALALTGGVLRPLAALSAAAKRIAEGDLTVRAAHTPRNDEIGVLAEAFNHMVGTVQLMTEELESQVAARTAELTEANEKLAHTNRELDQAVSELAELARTDGLTGLANHRAFQEALVREIERAHRTGRPLSMLMIDVDNFKNYNDAHGHPAGDVVLKGVAKTMAKVLRQVDVVARYGGEEFAVVLVETNREAGLQVAEKLRASIEALDFPGAADSQPLGAVTISIGLATCPSQADRPAALVSLADRALYVAKGQGRNQVATIEAA